MSKKLIIIITIVALFAIGLAVVGAQGNGNGGNGNGNRFGAGNGLNCDPQQPESCANDPQYNAYNYGGMGFVNAQDGTSWNGQQRGRMNRGAGVNGAGFYASLPPATVDALPQNVVDLMVSGWMDEQHAYAVYEGVISQFGDVNPFVNIQRAEAQHIAAWEFLFDRYGIAVPEVPTFDVPQFASVTEACQTGATAEVANFDLYDTMLEAFKDYPDLYQVALSLRNASEFNHLPAFQQCSG
ncbi:MAG: hypothetical protein R3E39_17050 [Anaerolineae bacterium]